ncbi:DUF1778 domain-containing protein [Alteromonas macleodii]|jgi:uncharacterized protein (DUF1778 family)|uniref:type II toxin-antitoxin system TacA family antitoxin n=1 Tax=Alteromonas TaxID=226 RepID=UPI000286F554|nr:MULTISPECIES: DUF1778 domain-containing protein [unclassified Alteromonas]AFT76830.1 hypothetical protein AMBLS11_01180 [Alteromonas macleodii str. 'Black Sea 11']MCH2056737.1 DUF1778 domain-containing protein [Thalassotalea sp.]MED5521625.1 DUF1778 domain-containing protein [Pseudomonadota bacterium]NKW88755.1 DUF1778 domain-containing protein [Alteromonadaceae bacterium A_SAG4]NKX03516.1 DUF1778 domain-containing protein [Alteromonadaceae bacterium A_SAG6]NKX17756.1 DUF1778 domain-contai|tara:strand:- start:1093 stop:1386 length:294 start_codon:yes stop_codon:yes gene_type:complete
MSAIANKEFEKPFGTEKPARIELKTTPTVKQVLEMAADLKGISLTAFMLSIAQEKAQQVIESSHVTRLTRDSWDALDRAMAKPAEPTAELRALMKRR